MRLSFPHVPIDIIVSIIWSVVLIPFVLFDIHETLRIIFGLPVILFIPGYILIFSLFPQAYSGKSIDIIERIALSFGLSIAIVPLLGLALNYTPWGIRLLPILTTLIGFIFIAGGIALYRWYVTPVDERFVITIDISFPRNESRLDQALTIILACSIIISLIVLVYVIVIPKTGEQFTEFYLLGPEGIADNYPRDIVIDEPINVIVGIVNHEYKPMNYTIELWLINQTFTYNESSKSNETVYHEMWFLDSIQTTLNHTPIDIEGPWEPQWEYNWMFSVDKKGEYKLCFLLTTDTFNEYDPMINYADIAYEKLRDSYRSTHLWVHVT